MHWREKLKMPYLGAWDLQNEDGTFKTVEVTIEGFSDGTLDSQLGKQSKTFVKLKEYPKKMVMNATNFKRLEKRFGSTQIEDYKGTVYLTSEKTKSPEGTVDALRFLGRKPTPKAKPSINEERFEKALEAISKGEFTKEKLESSYSLTEEQKSKL